MRLGFDEKQYLLKLLRRQKRGFEMDRICKEYKKIIYIKTEEELMVKKLMHILKP